jgi:hypothetical protein
MLECTSRRSVRQGIQHDKIVETANVTRACRTHACFIPRMRFAFVSKHIHLGGYRRRIRQPSQLVNHGARRRWDFERGETLYTLAHCLQGFTARRQDADIPSAFEQVLDQDRSNLNNSLATIRDDQHPLT